MTLAITGAVIGAAGVGVGAFNAFNSSQAQGSAQAKENTIFGEQQGYAQMLQQLIQNPSSVTSLPGYQFNFGQGANAVSSQAAAGGFAGSGNLATQLTQYGQNFAMSTYNQQAQLLSSLSGLTAPSSTAQLGSNALSASAQNTSNLSSLLNSLTYMTNMNTGAAAGTPGANGQNFVTGQNTGNAGSWYPNGG